MMEQPPSVPAIGIIGGSGVYEIDGLSGVEWRTVESPFGQPSDALMFAKLGAQPLVFLPRHGRGHKLPPGEINYRANIDALKRAGVRELISISAVGSLDESLPPGRFVMVDQYIDRTFAREKSFFGTGLVAHVSMARPTCRRLSQALYVAAEDLGIDVTHGGTYLAMEGPQFSSEAESALYRRWGCQVIGMTNMPEAKLAREAELCYASVAMVTDYDCWHPNHDAVSVERVVKVLLANAERGRNLIRAVVPKLSPRDVLCDAGCHRALDNAIITAPSARDPAMVGKLDAVAGRVLEV